MVTVLIGFPLVIALLWHPLASTALVVGISGIAHYEWLFTLSPLIVERLNNNKDHGAEVAGMSMVAQCTCSSCLLRHGACLESPLCCLI